MTRYLVQPGDWIFVKDYEFLSSAKNMGKNIGKNVSKNLRGKYCRKLVDYVKQSATDVLKTVSKRSIQKRAEATGDLIGITAVTVATVKSRKFKRIHNEKIEKQLSMCMINKYLRKHIYPKKEKKLLMNRY